MSPRSYILPSLLTQLYNHRLSLSVYFSLKNHNQNKQKSNEMKKMLKPNKKPTKIHIILSVLANLSRALGLSRRMVDTPQWHSIGEN